MRLERRLRHATIAGVLALSVAGCGLDEARDRGQAPRSEAPRAAPPPAEAPRPAPDERTAALPRDVAAPGAAFARVAEAVTPAVINITTEAGAGGPQRTPFEQFFGEEFYRRFFGDAPERMPRRSLGSGVIIDRSGVALTNAHVVDQAARIEVTTADGRKHRARLVGLDRATDLAVIQVEDGAQFPAAPLGDSDAVQVGEWVIAVGSPFGLRATVTAGIISAKARHIGAGAFDDFLQTDAAINPGNSGGPLVDLRGQVVGINTAIVAGGSGIGFAIPSALARRVSDELREHGRVSRGWLGVSVRALGADAGGAGSAPDEGALVAGVERDSPAARAGLRAGDVIVRFDDRPIQSPADLQRAAAMARPGTRATLTVRRDGGERRIEVRLGETPAGRAEAARGAR